MTTPDLDLGSFSHLRLRSASPTLIALPWELPLGSWTAGRADLRELPIGPSRHLVRFVKDEDRLIALKEEPLEIARREYEVLRHLEVLQLPAVLPLGLAELPGGNNAILVTEFLGHSLQYRRLLMRLPAGQSGGRGRLLDA